MPVDCSRHVVRRQQRITVAESRSGWLLARQVKVRIISRATETHKAVLFCSSSAFSQTDVYGCSCRPVTSRSSCFVAVVKSTSGSAYLFFFFLFLFLFFSFFLHTCLSTVGDQAFRLAAARTWNSLPQHVTSTPSMSVFGGRFKAFRFR